MISLNLTYKVKQKKRVGRGPSSGSGKTCGRGMNGQKSRSGSSVKASFEGGQISFMKKIKKLGAKPLHHTTTIKLSKLLILANSNSESKVVSYNLLRTSGIISSKFYKVILDEVVSGSELTLNVLKSDTNIKFSSGVARICKLNYV